MDELSDPLLLDLLSSNEFSQWFEEIALELIAAHSENAPNATRILDSLRDLNSHELVNKSPEELFLKLGKFVTSDPPCSKLQLDIFQNVIDSLKFSIKDRSDWLEKLNQQQIAGKTQICIETTHEFYRTCLLHFSRNTGLFSFHRHLVDGVFLIIRIRKENRDENYYEPIHAIVLSTRKNLLKEDEFLIEVEFQQNVDIKHGILESNHSHKTVQSKKSDYGVSLSPNLSLNLLLVGCPLCEETGLPFWSLKPNSIHEIENDFCVSNYQDPFPGFERCDFHPLRITVCPRCFFSSSRLEDFCLNEENFPDFNINDMIHLWKNQCPDLKKILNSLPSSFGTHRRSIEHGVIAYEVSIETLKHLYTLNKDEKTLFEIINLQLILADLLNRVGRQKEADIQRRKVLEKLEEQNVEFNDPRHCQALLRQFLLQMYFGYESNLRTNLEKLKNRASEKNIDLFFSKINQESFEKAQLKYLHRKKS